MRDANPPPPSPAIHSHNSPAPPDKLPRAVGRLRAWWSGLVGAIGVVVGLVPHLLHHVGLLTGTALVAGAAGTTLFGVLGLAASVPFLLRLRRRFGTWWAPVIGLAVFAVMFSVSAFVIGPTLTGSTDGPGDPQPTPSAGHNDHHG